MKFCSICGQVLNIDVSGPQMLYKCDICETEIKASVDEYILLTEKYEDNPNIINLINTVKHNPTIPTKKVECPVCKKVETAYVIRVSNTLKANYICKKCENHFV